MVVRRGMLIDLPAGGHVEQELEVGCASMEKAPSTDDFSLDLISPSDLVVAGAGGIWKRISDPAVRHLDDHG
jgi:hypothetical protein